MTSGTLVVQGNLLHGLKLQRKSGPNLSQVASRYIEVMQPAPCENITFVSDVPVSRLELDQEYSCMYLGCGETWLATNGAVRSYSAALLLRAVPTNEQVFERVGISSRLSGTNILPCVRTLDYEHIRII